MTNAETYCISCGHRLLERTIEGRDRHYCTNCERVQYRNPKPCAGILLIDGEHLLLVQRTVPPGVGTWSLPAGYLEYNEPPKHAAVRELHEEAGVGIAPEVPELFDTVFVRHPDGQHVLVLVYVAPVERTEVDPKAGGDASDARFWTLRELRRNGEQIENGYEELFKTAVRTVTT